MDRTKRNKKEQVRQRKEERKKEQGTLTPQVMATGSRSLEKSGKRLEREKTDKFMANRETVRRTDIQRSFFNYRSRSTAPTNGWESQTERDAPDTTDMAPSRSKRRQNLQAYKNKRRRSQNRYN